MNLWRTPNAMFFKEVSIYEINSLEDSKFHIELRKENRIKTILFP